MNLEELLGMLDLESPDEFQYFENLADLMECEEEILPETVYELCSQMDLTVLPELINNYFEELLENLPDDAADLYTLMHTIKLALSGMSGSAEEERDIVLFSDELCRFRNWYSFDSNVICRERSTSLEHGVTVRDAILFYRLEKLNEGEFLYDFDHCLDYPIEEYMMAFTDILPEDEEDEEEVELKDGELATGYIYDDEFQDDMD